MLAKSLVKIDDGDIHWLSRFRVGAKEFTLLDLTAYRRARLSKGDVQNIPFGIAVYL